MLGANFEYPNPQFDKRKGAAITPVREALVGKVRPALLATLPPESFPALEALAGYERLDLRGLMTIGRLADVPGGAVALAARKVRDKARIIASGMLEVSVADLVEAAIARTCEVDERLGTLAVELFDTMIGTAFGAGIVGVSVALHLQKRGRATVLVDRRGAAEPDDRPEQDHAVRRYVHHDFDHAGRLHHRPLLGRQHAAGPSRRIYGQHLALGSTAAVRAAGVDGA